MMPWPYPVDKKNTPPNSDPKRWRDVKDSRDGDGIGIKGISKSLSTRKNPTPNQTVESKWSTRPTKPPDFLFLVEKEIQDIDAAIHAESDHATTKNAASRYFQPAKHEEKKRFAKPPRSSQTARLSVHIVTPKRQTSCAQTPSGHETPERYE